MPSTVRLGHVALPCTRPRELASFYRDLLGLKTSMEGSIPELGEFVFLSEHAADNLPLIALCAEPRSRHTAVEVDSLAALKALHARATGCGIATSFALNHRCSVSLYFHDPEGNVIEVFWATGINTDEPYTEPLSPDDLDRPEAEILDQLGIAA